MTARQITVHDRTERVTFAAAFEAVRSDSGHSLGWATISTDEFTLRFPLIVHEQSGHVYPVNDWQAPFGWVDLADPVSVERLATTGQGTFQRDRTGRLTESWRKFADGHAVRINRDGSL